MQGIPCDLASTISTGSFLTGEVLDVSPADTGLPSDSTEDGISRDTASQPWNSSLPCRWQQRQGNLSGASETQLPEGDKYLHKGSQTQQILGSTGDLNSCSEENTHFQALPAELDFPETERPFPNFHHQFFQPLEPSRDSDSSSTCSQYRISEGRRDFSKISTFSRTQDISTLLEAGNSSLQMSSLPSGLETNGPNNCMSEEESVKDSVT
ncbi:CE295 protein, partial [Rhinopomastus cyanomelas]|nr:CE295 protein [Rhinopomastus cyanomelas]